VNARERFLRYMHFEKTDRAPFYEWFFCWGETLLRWYEEGLPKKPRMYDIFLEDCGFTLNWSINPTFMYFPDLIEYFGFDGRASIPIDFSPIPRFVKRVLEETEEYTIEIDEAGVKRKNPKVATSIPQFLEFPVKDKEDFEKIKTRYNPHDIRRYPKNWSEELVEYYNNLEVPLGVTMAGFFGIARNLMGLERLLISFYKNPSLVKEIMDFWADFLIETLTKAVEEVKIDYATLWEDMAYNRGPLISPRLFREFMLPNYQKVTKFLRKHGIDIIMVDSDGDITSLVPLFLEGGVNCLFPLEAKAGVDAVALRKKYGKRLLLIGNIDKTALAQGKEAIEREVNYKVPYLVKEGGYIPSVDHLVPPDVSFQNYTYYINFLKKYLWNR